MDDEAIRALKRAHDFERWRGRTTLAENLFVRGFFLADGILEGWRLERATPVELPNLPPYTQSIWAPEGGTGDVLLRLDVYECGSRDEAHELLLRLVGQFQAAGAARREDRGVGDVGFVAAGDHGIAFSRGNLVFLLVQAGAAGVPVVELARQLDRELSTKPDATRRSRRGRSRGARLAGTRRKGRWILDVASDAEDETAGEGRGRRRAYRKIFSERGEVHLEGDELVLEDPGPGPARVEVFTIDSEGSADREVVDESAT